MAENVEVRLGANVSQLKEGMAEGSASVDAGTASMMAGMEKLAASTAASAEEMSAATQKMAQGVVSASEESAGAMSLMGEKIKVSVEEAKTSLEGFAGAISGIQKAFSLLAEVAMLGFIGEQVGELGRKFAEYGEQVEIASHKTGLSISAVQELGFAARMSGLSSGELDQALVKLERSMGGAMQGNEKLKEAFQSFGIEASQLKDMSLDEVLSRIADSAASAGDGYEKTTLVTQLFGRASAELINMLDKGAITIQEFRDRAQELGLVMDGETVAAAAKLNEQYKELDAQMAAVKLRAGSELVPALSAIAQAMADSAQQGGVLDHLFSALAETMKFLVSVGMGVVLIFQQIAEVVVTAGVAANQAASGNFSTAAAAINIGLANMKANAEATDAAFQKLWGDAGAASGLDMGESGGGKDGWGEKNKLKLGSGKAPKAGGGGKGPGDISIWKDELQQQEEASNDFFKSNLAFEEQFWQSKLALTKTGSKEYLAVHHELYAVKKQEAQQDLASAVETIKGEYDAAQQGSIQRINLANDIAQKIGEAYGYESKQYEAALIQERKAAQEWAKQQTKDLDDQIVQAQKAAIGQIAVQEQVEKGKLARSEESQTQELSHLLAFENQKFAIEMKAYSDEMALYNEDDAAYKKLLDAKLAATQKHAIDVEKLQQQSADSTQKAWQTALSPISSAFTASVNGMIAGTTTWQAAMGRMVDSILAKFIDMGVQMVVKWVANQAAMMTASMNSSAFLQALGLQDAITAQAASTTEALATIGADASVAAAGAYAATAAIPFVGPELAPAAAAQAYGATMAFAGSIPAYEGGSWQVPERQLAMLHTDEMVLPSWGAQGIRDMVSGGPQAQSSTPNVSVTYAPNMGGVIGAEAFKGLLAQHSDQVMDAVYAAMRNFRK